MCSESTDNVVPALEELMFSFLEHYVPAVTWDSADEYFTSAEIAGMFNSVCTIPPENIFAALKENGFICVPLSGRACFVWLLTLKKK